MSEIRPKMIKCAAGVHYYDANKFSSCPFCSGANDFGPTTDPFAGSANAGMAPTEAPGSAPSPDFGKTIYPDAGFGGSNGSMGVTVPPADGGYSGGGFNDSMGSTIFVNPASAGGNAEETVLPCVGWVVVVEGPNRGRDYRIHTGYNYIGRKSGDIIITGDDTISGERDSSITYVYQTKKFYMAHENGKNVLLVNNIPVVGGGTELKNYDIITIGTTKLVFLGLCGDNFGWEDKERSNA